MARRGRRFGLVAAVLLVGLASRGTPALASSTSGLARLTGHVLPALAQATRLPDGSAGASGSDPLTLTLTLKRTDEVGFDTLLNEIQNPSSPNYQHYLTQQQLADRFGPSQKAYDAVLHWLQSQGFTLTEGSANRLTLTVSGTRQQAARALRVHIGDYQSNGRSFYANDVNPSLPGAIAPSVQAIVGLSDLAQAARAYPAVNVYSAAVQCAKDADLELDFTTSRFCMAVYVFIAAIYSLMCIDFNILTSVTSQPKCDPWNPAALAPRASSGAAGSRVVYDPPTHHSANAPPATIVQPGMPGAGQKLGLLEYDTFNRSDVDNFLALIGLPALQSGQLNRVDVNGGVPTPGPGEREVLVDLDVVLQLASSAKVSVYDAPASTSFQTLFNAMLNDPAGPPTVISNSWTYCEDQTTLADVQSIDTILAQSAAAGISTFNASGDTGSTCRDGSPNTIGVPADSPHGTAVGGTTVQFGPGLTYGGETWWNGSAATTPTGQGGFGQSRFFSRPAYQNGFTSAPMRSIPDVSASADPASHGVMICEADAGGCPTVLVYGGTSAAAPEWAAYAAMLNQLLPHNIGNFNSALSAVASGTTFHTAATMASDFAHVGLGSPKLNQLLLALDGRSAGAVDPTSSRTLALPSSGAVADGSTQAIVQVTLQDANDNYLPGKSVGLTASAGSHAVIAPASGPSDAGGNVTFAVTDTVPETLTLTATDTTDNVVLQQMPALRFVTPPATAANIVANPASPTPVPADGSSSATVTVTLQNAQNQPAAGKTVTLSQGSGHSIATGSGVSNASGQAVFTVTDTVTENVTYTAVDVTDGNLPVPGSAAVNFTNSPGTNCPVTTPVVSPGYAVTTFIAGFANCGAPFGLAFDASGNLFVDDLRNNKLLKFGPIGGTVTAANLVATIPPPAFDPDGLAFGKDGKLYMAKLNSKEVDEINPTTGAVVRTLASGLPFPLGLAVDPISGDLFVSLGATSNSICRITNPSTSQPGCATYSSVGGADGLVFAPDGTLYAAVGNDEPTRTIVKLASTTAGTPGALLATFGPVPTVDGLGLGTAAGGAVVVYGNRNDGTITKVDTGTSQMTDFYTGGSRGDFATVGPDGCLYATQTDRVLKVTNADGSCTLTPSGVQPSIGLSPAAVAPNPQQGTSTTFTAVLRNVPNPAGTPVTFVVSGANNTGGLVYPDSTGKASFTYVGVHTGTDTVVATTGSGATALISNSGRVTWSAGLHTSFATLNPSVTAGDRNLPVTVTGNLSDVSAIPAAALAGKTLSFSLSGAPGQTCTGTTDNAGTAACAITPTVAAGSYTLTVSFAGTPEQSLPSSDRTAFTVIQPLATTVTYIGPTTIGNGGPVTLSATLKDSANAVVAGRTLSFTLGSGPGAQTCTGITDATGTANCVINPVNQPLGPSTVAVAFAGDEGYTASSTTAVVTISNDATPPMVTCSATPSQFGPPADGALHPVTLNVTVSDSGSGPNGFTLTSITSNEAVTQADYPGFVAGTVYPQSTTSVSGQVRAAVGASHVRYYTFLVTGRDMAGNTATCTTRVTIRGR